MSRHFFLLVYLLLSLQVFSQPHTITGKVVDEEGMPLFGATVYLHETFQGVSSDEEGNFKLRGIKAGNYHLHITFVGYHGQSLDIRVSDSMALLHIVMHESHLELHEAVVEENALKLDKADYPVIVQLIGETSLKKNQGATLSQSLEHIPGINSMSMGVGISKPVIRGLSGNRIVVAENGIKQEGQQWGNDHGLEIDPFQAERVEIIKGPGSLLYGSDAMGGIVHIKQPLIPTSGKHEGKIIGLYKSVNNSWGSSFSARGNQKGWVYRVRGTVQDYADYKVPADSFLYNRYYLPIANGRLKNTAGKEQHFSGQLGVHRNWGYSRVTVSNYNQQIGMFSGATGIPRAYKLNDDSNARNIDLPNQVIRHFKVISNSNFQVGNNWIEADLGYQDNQREENSAPHAHGQPIGTGDLAHGLRLQTLSLNTRYHQDVFKGTRTIGMSGQYQTNRFKGYEFLMPNFETSQAGVYLFRKFQVNTGLVWSGGLRFDYGYVHLHRQVQAQFQNGIFVGEQLRVEENTRSFYNWSGSVGFSKMFSHGLNLKMNLGKSFRLPSAQELSVNGVHHGSFRHEMGDPTLNPEEGYQFDLSLISERKSWSISVSPFVNYFRNYIYIRPTAKFSTLPEAGQVFQFEQDKALLAGGEISVEYHPIKSIHIEGAIEMVIGQNLSENLPLPLMPPIQLKSAIEWESEKDLLFLKQPYLRLAWVLAASQTRVDRNEKSTDGYNLFHFGLGSKIKVSKREADLSINVRNLFNSPYYNHLSRWRYLNIPEPGRNIVVQLAIPIW